MTKYLAQIPYLKKLKHLELLRVIYSLKKVNYFKGKEILKKGECPDYIFLLVEGQIDLKFNFNGKRAKQDENFETISSGAIGFMYT